MLLEYSVGNFRSIRDRQTLSLIAGSGSARQQERAFSTGNSLAPNALRVACLFGSNGSGKSTLISSMSFFGEMVVESAKDKTEGEQIDVVPFKFDNEFSTKPSEFEVKFVHGNSFYQYGFSADAERIHGEWLFVRANDSGSRMRTLFQREFDEASEAYQWEINSAFAKREVDTLKARTRDNALFLSVAVMNNFEPMKEPFNWIRRNFRVADIDGVLSGRFTSRQMQAGWSAEILELMQAVDLRISDIVVEEKEYKLPARMAEYIVEEKMEAMRAMAVKSKTYSVKTIHKLKDGSFFELNMSDESEGTQIIYALAGPIIDVLKGGYTLFVDELHNSLHPLALRYIIGLFQDPVKNPDGAQLIFTSHETSVMAKNFLHKDQIWFLDRDESQATHLYPLSDFNVRDGDAFQKAYLDGRYGGLPVISRH